MVITVDDYLEAIEPYLPQALISPEAFWRIRTIACHLPPMATVGFEARLGDDMPHTDFATCVVPSYGGRDVLAGPAALDLTESRLANPAWQRIRSFCRHWADPASPFHENVDSVWLEFDVDGQFPETPGVLFGIVPTQQGQRIAEEGLRILMKGALRPELARNLALCFQALPAGAHIFQVGLMLSRPLDGVRVCVGGILPHHIQDYLTAIAWPGPINEVKEMLVWIAGFVKTVCLALDVGSSVSPKIGIECFVYDHRYQDRPSLWQPLLDHLVDSGLCTPEKRDGLLKWRGYNFRQFVWWSVFLRGLNHVKVVYQPDHPPLAKAYFGFMHSWVGDVQRQQGQETETRELTQRGDDGRTA